jgi:putative ABC transport system ATP-binding protein
VANEGRVLTESLGRAPGGVLHLESVSKRYVDGTESVWACRMVDLSLGEGELVLVRGPSGAGKSTLLLAAAGLVEVDSGVVVVDGTRVTDASEAERARLRLERVGVVFQDYLLVEEYSAEENVLLPLEARGWAARRARDEARQWLDAVGLDGLARRRPAELSGGQRQRVAIARALAGDKRLILADEPTGSLDSHASADILALLRKLADNGAAVVLASHDPEAATVADHTFVMRDGILAYQNDR